LNVALAICEKLYPDYVSFAGKRSTGDATLLREALDFCKVSMKPENTDLSAAAVYINKLEEISPDKDDYSSWDVTYAYNAISAVLELLKFYTDSSDLHISNICSLMIDTTDFRIAAANEHLSDDGIFKHPDMLEAMKFITGQLSPNTEN
jgi:uncharacterized protein YjaG (DUF416 family)